MDKKLVVIGSNSFSGASFIGHTLDQGYEVIGISRSTENIDALLPYKWTDNKNYRFKQFDLNLHTQEIVHLIKESESPYIINFAAQAMVAESWQNPTHWYQTNVVANVRLHDELRKLDCIKKYVHISTPEVYGSCEGVVDENYRFNPSTPYATSRAACDMHLMNFYNNYKFPVVFTRAANVYGPGQQLYRIIPRTILYIKLGKKLQLHGGGHSLRSFIHIKDVAEGTLKVALEAEPPSTYHFSTDKHVSIRNLVELICEKMNANFDELVEVSQDRPGKDSAYLLGTERAIDDLNWNPNISLEQGITETVKWIDKYFDILKEQPLAYIHKK